MNLVERLAAGGFVAAEEEAAELVAAAGGDAERLEAMVVRRLSGEPLAWITGVTEFCGLTLRVDPGVYVPRLQTEDVAARAAARLPRDGAAVDVCTGCGAIAAVLQARHPAAQVFATDADERAVAFARSNGVNAVRGDLLAPLAALLDLVTGVVPYVPTGDLRFLQRDTLTFETPLSYDGGPDGAGLLRRVIADAPRLLRPGGALVLELGGDQATLLAPDLAAAGFTGVVEIRDEDGDVRGIEATLEHSAP